MRHGVYPGSFNPLTIAHVAIAEAALDQLGLDALDLAVSRVALAKESLDPALLKPRVEALRRFASRDDRIGVIVTDAQLLADVAAGYDVLIVGADKWAQLHDRAFYGDSEEARDKALARLPPIAIVPRPPFTTPADARATILELPPELAAVSSSAVRAGRDEWLASAAGSLD